MKTFCRDLCIAMLALPVGLVLLWAGNSNYLEVLLVLLLMLIPMGACFIAARNWPKPDFDNQ